MTTSGRCSGPGARTTRPSRSSRSSPADPARLGRIVRGEFGTVEAIVEAKDATEEELANNEVNAGLYAFDADWLRRRIGSLKPSAATGELYLTEFVQLAREDGRLVIAVAFEDDGRFDGINDRSQLAAAEWNLRVRRNEEHMRAGVTMRDPSTVYLDWDVTLAPDVTLEPNVILRGATSIGEGSVIGPGSQISNSTIGRKDPCVGVGRRVVDGRGRGNHRTVQPPSARQRRRPRRRGRQLRGAEEHPSRAGLEAAPHELPRRYRDRRGRQHRRRDRHRQLRRQPQAQDDHRRWRIHRRRHHDRRATRHRRGCQDRRRGRRDQGRAGGQARRRRARTHPRTSSETAVGREGRDRTVRRAVGTRAGDGPS